MKITMVLGSPREDSVSTKLAMRFAEGAEESGHEIKIYKVNEMEMLGCQACGCCRRHDTDCVIEDDLTGYFEDLRESGALVITSPNYYSQVTGPMITFMNRHYCLMDKDRKPRLVDRKKLYAFFAQGAQEGYEKYIPNYEWYVGTFTSKNMELVKQITAGGDSDVDAMCAEAYEAGKSL
ncbi:MAG: flavodoxin family protein [Bacillota bacterium]|nr:flavodoxin family protein [Bacillota bacterium]